MHFLQWFLDKPFSDLTILVYYGSQFSLPHQFFTKTQLHTSLADAMFTTQNCEIKKYDKASQELQFNTTHQEELRSHVIGHAPLKVRKVIPYVNLLALNVHNIKICCINMNIPLYSLSYFKYIIYELPALCMVPQKRKTKPCRDNIDSQSRLSLAPDNLLYSALVNIIILVI